MSRAQWIALGCTVSAVGCTTVASEHLVDSGADASTAEAGAVDASPGDEASDDGPIAANDAAARDGAAAACTTRSGTFGCTPFGDASIICDRRTQYCDWTFDGVTADHCSGYGDPDGSRGVLPPQCLPCPTCGCLADAGWSGNCPGSQVLNCGEDDAGALSFLCHSTCYGSPPARFDRIPRDVS